MDEVGAEVGGGDDVIEGADSLGAGDVVDVVELVGHLTKLLGVDRLVELVPAHAQAAAVSLAGLGDPGLQLLQPTAGPGAALDVAGEHTAAAGAPPITAA